MSSNGPPGSNLQVVSGGDTPLTDAECVTLCNQVIESFKRGDQSKGDYILSIYDILLRSASVKAGKSLGDALVVYLDIVEEVCHSRQPAVQRETASGGTMLPESWTATKANQDGAPDGGVQVLREAGVCKSGKSDENGGSSDAQSDRPAKRRKVEPDFTQHRRRSTELSGLPSEIRKTFDQIDLFSSDPNFVVENILSTPGCPLFPPSQWLNLVQWKYVDLAKVLEVVHTTDIDAEQTYVIDKVGSSIRVSRPNKYLRNAFHHTMAFTMYVKALGFVFPQRREEFADYQTSIGHLFLAVDPAFHHRIIDYDCAVRNRISVCRHLRITDSASFDDLRVAYLSPFGTGTHCRCESFSSHDASCSSSSLGLTSQQRDPCHKWNRGTCYKTEAECFFSHCCDLRGCRGNHRRLECPRNDRKGLSTAKPPRNLLGAVGK